jgi:predicted O-methyltransferase YrrM
MTIDLTAVKDVDVSYMEQYYPSEYSLFPINSAPSGTDGGEHYKLLDYLSSLFIGGVLLDCGTRTGMSAFALGHNRQNEVISYDLIPANPLYRNGYPNITFKQMDVLKEAIDVFNRAGLIFIDLDPHDGKQETEFLEILRGIDYKGIIVLDDITYPSFPGMIKFWNDIPEKKYDVTKFGHGSGTGIVDFSGKLEIIWPTS